MNEYWVSWYHETEFSEFELHSPWWVSGWRLSDDASTIVAAVRAESEDAAMDLIQLSYDIPPEDIGWRFCESLDGRSPFSDRFPQADWMVW